MEDLLLEVVLIAGLLLINGLFSMTEIAVVSARRLRLQSAANAGNKGAAVAVELQESPDKFLSTVQIGITLVGILSGAFGGALLAEEAAAVVEQVPALAPYAPQIGFGIVILIITYFSLVIGELVPKNIALNMPERVASFFSRPMRVVSRLTAPVVWVLSHSTRLILRLFRVPEVTDHVMTEDEIRAHIAHGTEVGVFHSSERELIDRVLRLDDVRSTTLMTPRVKIDWIDLDSGDVKAMEDLANSHFSRLPVGRGRVDNIVGIVEKRDVLGSLLDGKDVDLAATLREATFVPETITGLELLGIFKEKASDMAIIVDEFGSVEGLVTLKDVLEEIVGDFKTEGDSGGKVVVRDDGSMLVDGNLTTDEFLELVGLDLFPADENGMYQTIAGFALTRFERLPTEGEHFEWEGFRFEVVDMDGRRVDKLLVKRNDDEPSSTSV